MASDKKVRKKYFDLFVIKNIVIVKILEDYCEIFVARCVNEYF